MLREKRKEESIESRTLEKSSSSDVYILTIDFVDHTDLIVDVDKPLLKDHHGDDVVH